MSLIANISRETDQKISWASFAGFGVIGIGALVLWKWNTIAPTLLDFLSRYSDPLFVSAARKRDCVAIVWGDKQYEVLPSCGKTLKVYFDRRVCLYPAHYGMSKTYSDAIISSLKNSRVEEALKLGGYEAFLDAVLFVDTFKCEQLIKKLYTYFSTDLLCHQKIPLDKVDEMITFFQDRKLDSFIKPLLYYAMFQQEHLTPVFESAFQGVFKQSGHNYKEELEKQFPCCDWSVLRNYIHILLIFIGKEETLKLWRNKYLTPGRFYYLLKAMPHLPEFLNVGGSFDELMQVEEFSRLAILRGSSHLAEFIRQGGKLVDLYKTHSGMISYILENSDKLEAFKKIGGSIDKLYTVKSNCNIPLIFEHLDKIPFYLEQGGTWDDLYAIEPSALDYLLQFSANIPDFIAAGGKLSDLYNLPKERNTAEGAKVGPLLELAKNLRQWTTLGGALPQLYDGNVDTGIVRTVLENVDHLKNYMNKGGSLDRLLKLDYWRIMQALQV
jgi:hypothetical protein